MFSVDSYNSCAAVGTILTRLSAPKEPSSPTTAEAPIPVYSPTKLSLEDITKNYISTVDPELKVPRTLARGRGRPDVWELSVLLSILSTLDVLL